MDVMKIRLIETFYLIFLIIHCVTILLLFSVVLAFGKRAYTMVDVLSNRLHDAYANWAIRPTDNDSNTQTMSGLRRFGFQQRRPRTTNKETTEASRNRHIFQSKDLAPLLATPQKPRPFMGLSCHSCTPTSRDTIVKKATESLNVKNILQVDALNAKNGFFTRKFCHLSQICGLRKFEYPQIADTVLRDERLKEALQMATEMQMKDMATKNDTVYQSLFKKNEERAKAVLLDMRSTLSDFLLRLTSWVLYKLLPCFLSSVVAHPVQIEMLKKAGDSGVPLIFLPLHRSHLDYILISFILLNNNVRSPLVAAGDNLRIPFFGSLLRGLGAFYIKRRIDPVAGRKDIVYRAVLHTYMMEALRAGHNIEFFIEGGRTRTGKPCMPKGGILSVIVDAYMDGTIEDALLVPVSVNYERLVDGNFVREQLGQPKEMETFSSAIKGIWSVLNSNYGMMRIDFNQPFSIRELIKTFHVPSSPPLSNGTVLPADRRLVSTSSTASLYGTDVVEEKHRLLVESIARHVIYDATQSTAVMSTNAVAFLLLNRFREGTTMEQLVAEFDKLRNELLYFGRDVGFSGDSLDVINHALDVLGPALVRHDKTESTIRPVAMLPNVIELAYYSNGLMSVFVIDSVVATALYTLLPEVHESTCLLTQDELVQKSLELCELLKYEFIFCKPCQNLESIIIETIDNLKTKEVLSSNEQMYTDSEKWSRRYAKHFDDEEYNESAFRNTTPDLIFNVNESSLDHVSFLRGLLRPLVEAYSITALTLDKLVGTQMAEKDFVQDVLEEIKTQFHLRQLNYSESLSVDPVKNCMKILHHWNVLESHSQDKIKLFYLSDQYDNCESVKQIYNKISYFKTNITNQ